MKHSSLALVGLFLLVGCGDQSTPQAADIAPDPAASPSRAPMASGHRVEAPAVLPPGHPGLTPEAAELAWTVPASWTAEAPSSAMRRAQYRVGPETTCIVFYFGTGQGGDSRSNAMRWASQFTQEDGSDSTKAMTFRKVASAIPIQVVEVSGTYQDGMAFRGPSTPRPNHRLLGAIVEPSAGERWFFKLVGPTQSVEGARADFDDLVRSFRWGGQ